MFDLPNLQVCCLLSQDCFHFKISEAIGSERFADGLVTLDQEGQDISGDTTLHFAARHGASLKLLSRILSLAPEMGNTQNLRGETFMHVLLCSMISSNPTQAAISIGGTQLRVSRQGFDGTRYLLI